MTTQVPIAGIERDFLLFEMGILGSIRNPKLKCPLCKKIKLFNQFDLNCNTGTGYLEGMYARAYVCSNCNVLIVKTEKELTQALKILENGK